MMRARASLLFIFVVLVQVLGVVVVGDLNVADYLETVEKPR